MADQEERVRINFQTNAGQVAGQVNNLGDSLDGVADSGADATRSMHNLDASFDEIYGDIRPLTTQLGELEDRLYQLQQSGQGASEEFRALTQEAARLRQAQQAVDRQVDATAQTIGQKLGSAAQIATAGISAVASGMALFGGASEETEKALLKVQAAMSFADSISSLVEMKEQFGMFKDLVVSGYQRILAARRAELAATTQQTIAQRILNITALANPYIAVAAAITALVVVTYMWVKASREEAAALKVATSAVDSSKKSTGQLADSIKNAGKNLSEYNNLEVLRAKALGASDAEIQKLITSQKELALTQAKLDRTAALNNAAQAETAYLAALKTNNEALIKDAKDNSDKALELLETTAENLTKTRISVAENNLQIQVDELNKSRELEKKALEERKRIAKEELDRYRGFLAEQKRIREEGEAAVRKSIDDATEKNINGMISAQESELRAVKDKYFGLIEAAKQYGYDTNQLEIARLNELNDINLKYQKENDDREKERRNKELEEWGKEAEERVRISEIKTKHEEESKDRMLANGEQLAAGVKVLAEKNKGIQRAAIIAEGGINAGKTVANTATAIASDLKLGFPANIAPIALDVAVGATSLASIVKGTNDALKAVGGGSAPNVGSGSGNRAVSDPSVAFNNTSENQIAQATAKAQAEQPPIKVYVQESDITDSQNNVKALVETNTF